MADLGNLVQGLNSGLNSGVDTYVKLKQLGMMEEEQKKKRQQEESQKDMQAVELNLKLMSDKNIPNSMKKASANTVTNIMVKHGFMSQEQVPQIDKWEDSYNDYAKKLHGIYQSVQKGEIPFDKGMQAFLQTLADADTEEKRKYSDSVKGQMENFAVGKLAQEYGDTGNQWTPSEKTSAMGQAMQYAGTKGAEELRKVMSPEGKEFNTPADLDGYFARIAGKLGLNYSTKEGRMAVLDIYGKSPALQEDYIKYQGQLSSAKAQPIYNIVPTSEGLQPVNIRTGEPKGKTIGDKPNSSEMIVANQQIGTLKETLQVIKDNFDNSYVGAVSGRVSGVKEVTTGLPEKEAKFRAAIAQAKNSLVYLMSGKQINEQEYNRLLKQLPDASLPSSTFKARINEFERTLNSIIENRAKFSGGYGASKNTGNLGQMQKQPTQSKFKILKVE